MSAPVTASLDSIVMFLSPIGQRRVDFQQACGELCGRLFLADGTEQAAVLLRQQGIDLFIIDLAGFERGIDQGALEQLIGLREGRATLLICPFASASWLPALMACGPIKYAIGPLLDADLRELVTQASASSGPPATGGASGQADLLALHHRLQRALTDADDVSQVAEHLCAVFATFPGVAHAALFHFKLGELGMEAQASHLGLDLTRLFEHAGQLQQCPLRHAFPGLLAACNGEMALLDAPEKAGDPELAIMLSEHSIAMVLGLPIVSGSGVPRGALCLMFDQWRAFSHEELASFASLAQLAGLGLRMAEMSHESEQLVARLTQLASTDALTGAANRRQGEALLEQEIRRARRNGVSLALILFDVDRFKEINDQYGHACGDAALRMVVATAQEALRETDLVARTGGEEFLVIAPHTSAIDALRMAETIRAAIAQTDFPGVDRLTVSLSVAQLGEQEIGETLMRRLNAAMARAKRAGRNCVELAMQ